VCTRAFITLCEEEHEQALILRRAAGLRHHHHLLRALKKAPRLGAEEWAGCARGALRAARTRPAKRPERLGRFGFER
jgi:hypothetical protein